MKVFVLYLIAFFFLTGCVENSCETDYTPSPKSRLSDEIGKRVFLQLKEQGLYPFECGGRMMDEITLLHLGFLCYKDIEIEDARKLLIAAGNLFLETINNDELIRPYLKTHPFLPQNIEIRIFFKNSDGSDLGYEKLHIASLVNGVMEYDTINANLPNRLTTICEERFEEAASKIPEAVSF